MNLLHDTRDKCVADTHKCYLPCKFEWEYYMLFVFCFIIDNEITTFWKYTNNNTTELKIII